MPTTRTRAAGLAALLTPILLVVGQYLNVTVDGAQRPGRDRRPRALNPPEDIQDTVDQLLADTQTALDEMVETAASDPAAMFTSNEETFADVNARATKLGLTACGGNAQSDG